MTHHPWCDMRSRTYSWRPRQLPGRRPAKKQQRRTSWHGVSRLVWGTARQMLATCGAARGGMSIQVSAGTLKHRRVVMHRLLRLADKHRRPMFSGYCGGKGRIPTSAESIIYVPNNPCGATDSADTAALGTWANGRTATSNPHSLSLDSSLRTLTAHQLIN